MCRLVHHRGTRSHQHLSTIDIIVRFQDVAFGEQREPIRKVVFRIARNGTREAFQTKTLQRAARFPEFRATREAQVGLELVQQEIRRHLGNSPVTRKSVLPEILREVAYFIERVIRRRHVLLELAGNTCRQEQDVGNRREFQPVRNLRHVARKFRHVRLQVFQARVPRLRVHRACRQDREESVPVEHAVLEAAGVFRELRVPALVLEIVLVIIEGTIAIIELVVVIAVAHGCRRGELHAVLDTRGNLHGALERVVRTVTRDDAPLRGRTAVQRILGHEVYRATQSRTAELRRHTILVNLYPFDIVEVDCPQVGSATASIVQGNAVNANQHVACGNPADGHRLETAHAALLVTLDSRKRRYDFGCRKPHALPCGRRNLHIVGTRIFRLGDSEGFDLGDAQILHGGRIVNRNILG